MNTFAFASEIKKPCVLTTQRTITQQDIPEGILLLELDGTSMTSQDGFYNEFEVVLKFPDYFGRNGAAFDECITDLEWLPADGYLLIIKNSEYLLNEESDDIFAAHLSALNRAGEEWATPITQGEEWDREGLPFHTILELGGVNLSGFQKKLRQVSFEIPPINWKTKRTKLKV